MKNNTAQQAAKFYLQHIGKRGTDKQVQSLFKSMTSEMIIRLATDRGFVQENNG